MFQTLTLGVALAAAFAFASTPAVAQYPTRPITVMVGFAAGGTSDVAARIVGEHMSRTLGQTVIVENRTGAGGSVAASALTRAAPDGYTIMLIDPGAFAINPILAPDNARYDPTTDFTPVALVGQSPLVLVTPATRPFRDFRALTDHVRSRNGEATFASSGVAGIAQFGAEVYMRRAGQLSAVHVPYRGGAPMMEALLKGEVDFGMAVLGSAAPMIEQGTVRALALASPSATPAVAGVPLLETLGVADARLSSWVIMIGPKGMAAETVIRLNAAINAAIADGGVRDRLLRAGIETYPAATPAETGAFLADEVSRYRSFRAEIGDRLTR